VAKFTEIDDELDAAVTAKKTTEPEVKKAEEPETKKTAESEKKTTAASGADEGDDDEPVIKGKKSAAAATDDSIADELEWGDEKTMSRSGGLDRLRPEKGKAVRFAIIPWLKPLRALTHFIDKKGTFRCLATEDEPGLCCKKLAEDGQLTIAALVLHYTNAPSKDGKYRKDEHGRVPPIEWAIEYVQLGQTNYRDISELAPEGKVVTDLDIVMTHKDSGIGYKFVMATDNARWRQNEALVAEVKEACAKFMDRKKLNSKLGKKVSLAEMKIVLQSLVAGAEDQSLDDVEEL
jgi:hypothetical protein